MTNSKIALGNSSRLFYSKMHQLGFILFLLPLGLTLAVASRVQAAPIDLLSGDVTLTEEYPLGAVRPGFGPSTVPTADGIGFSGYTFTFTGNTISYFNPYAGPYDGDGTDFNGWVLEFAGVPSIAGVTNDAASDMDPLSIWFDSDTIRLNFSGLVRPGATTSIFNVTFADAEIPEPATLALVGAGMIGFCALRRRRRAVVSNI
jgi:hypothetical protein